MVRSETYLKIKKNNLWWVVRLMVGFRVKNIKVFWISFVAMFMLCAMTSLAFGAALGFNEEIDTSAEVVTEVSDRSKADRIVNALRQEGVAAQIVQVKKVVNILTVRLGPYADVSEAEQVWQDLLGRDVGAVLTEDKESSVHWVLIGEFLNSADFLEQIRLLKSYGYQENLVIKGKRDERYVFRVLEVDTFELDDESQAALFEDIGSNDISFTFDAENIGIKKNYFRISANNGRFISNKTKNEQFSFQSEFGWRWPLTKDWATEFGVRLDVYGETGKAKTLSVLYADEPSFVRYSGESNRVTLGTQKVSWGTVDEISPLERFTVQDLSRAVLEPIVERLRSVFALRWQHFSDEFSMDFLVMPKFKKNILPAKNSAWFPINQQSGQMLGVSDNQSLSAALNNASITEGEASWGGAGLRFTGQINDYDAGASFIITHRATPYYRLVDETKTRVLDAMTTQADLSSLGEFNFIGDYPRLWLLGGDVAYEIEDYVVRFETAFIKGEPATNREFEMISVNMLETVGALEFFPGDTDLRANLQLMYRKLITGASVLETKSSLLFTGSLTDSLDLHEWRYTTRFIVGLKPREIYLNPSLSYIGLENQVLRLSLHYFAGKDGTLGHFYDANSHVSLDWQGRF